MRATFLRRNLNWNRRYLIMKVSYSVLWGKMREIITFCGIQCVKFLLRILSWDTLQNIFQLLGYNSNNSLNVHNKIWMRGGEGYRWNKKFSIGFPQYVYTEYLYVKIRLSLGICEKMKWKLSISGADGNAVWKHKSKSLWHCPFKGPLHRVLDIKI